MPMFIAQGWRLAVERSIESCSLSDNFRLYPLTFDCSSKVFASPGWRESHKKGLPNTRSRRPSLSPASCLNLTHLIKGASEAGNIYPSNEFGNASDEKKGNYKINFYSGNERRPFALNLSLIRAVSQAFCVAAGSAKSTSGCYNGEYLKIYEAAKRARHHARRI